MEMAIITIRMAIITIRIEEEVGGILIIEETKVVEDQVVNLHNLVHLIISNKANLVLVV